MLGLRTLSGRLFLCKPFLHAAIKDPDIGGPKKSHYPGSPGHRKDTLVIINDYGRILGNIKLLHVVHKCLLARHSMRQGRALITNLIVVEEDRVISDSLAQVLLPGIYRVVWHVPRRINDLNLLLRLDHVQQFVSLDQVSSSDVVLASFCSALSDKKPVPLRSLSLDLFIF